jgi:hypothetical protein
MKALVILLCVLLGLAGLFMSACGGFFLIADLASGSSRMGFWTIALPALLVGLACIWGAVAGIRRTRRNTSNGEPRR